MEKPADDTVSDGQIIEIKFEDLSGVHDVPIQLQQSFVHALRSVFREFQIQSNKRKRRDTGDYTIEFSTRIATLEGRVGTIDDDGRMADQVREFSAKLKHTEDSVSAVKSIAYKFFGFAISVAATAGGIAWTMNQKSAESAGESRVLAAETRKTIDRLEHEVEILRTMLNDLLLKKRE